MTPTIRLSLAALFGSGAMLLGAGVARAQSEESSCDTHADCGKGMLCTVVGGSACPGIACPDGADCPEPPPCEPVEIKACVPGATCASDADCGADMRCVQETQTTCSGGVAPTCPPNTDCYDPPSAPEQCTTTSSWICLPKYAAPCMVASDCGEGFDCVEEQSCGCSGSSGGGTDTPMSGAGSGGASGDSPGSDGSEPAPMPVPPESDDCFCEPTGAFQCVPQDIECAADTDCPASWTCEDFGYTSVGGCAGPAPSPDGEPVDAPECDPMETVVHDYKCAPPYDGYYGRGDYAAGGENGGATAGEDDPTSPGAPPPSGSQGNDADDDASESGSSGSGDDGGCQMGRGRTGSASALLLGMLGLAAALRRRGVSAAR